MVEPALARVKKGSNASFLCMSHEEVIWEFSSGSLPANSITKNGYKKNSYSLIIYNVTPQNVGTYSCLGKDNRDVHFFGKAELQIISERSHFFIRLINACCSCKY